MSAPPYYIDVVSCKENCPVVCNHNVPASCERRDGSKASPEDMGWIPRGSTTRAKPGNLDLMWIMINPGEPQIDVEGTLYAGKEGAELADEAWAFTESVLVDGTNRSLRKLYTEMAKVRGCDEAQVLDYCMLTNVVRCSTSPRWSEAMMGKKEDRKKVVQTCSNKHLRQEIEYWKPKALIAVGEDPRKAIGSLDLGWEHLDCGYKARRQYDTKIKRFVCVECKQPVNDWGYIAHPAAWQKEGGPNSSENRAKHLDDLRDSMRELWD